MRLFKFNTKFRIAAHAAMKYLIKFFKKIIPAYIEIRSLYWVEHGSEMDKDLKEIFDCLDNDEYNKAKELIDNFEEKFTQNGVPMWIAIKYCEIQRAISMYHFLKD